MIELDSIDSSSYIRRRLKDYIHMDPNEEEATIAIMMNPKHGKAIQNAARNRLLQSHIRLVYGVAYMYARRYNKVVGDMFQAGYMGMFNATLKYDPRRGVKFTSFAIWWITQKIQEEIYVENCKVHCPMYTKAEAARRKGFLQPLPETTGRFHSYHLHRKSRTGHLNTAGPTAAG